MTDIRWPTPDGEAHGRIFFPGGQGPWPLVVFCMDAFGLRPALTTMAERLVAAGYAVAQPELYWRSGPYAPFDARTTFSDPVERPRIQALMNALKPSQVGDDVEALLAHLAHDPRVRPGPVGLIGYCMGGRQAFFLAARLGDRAAAMASIHGGGLVRPDPSSPQLGAPRIRARCYFAVADKDNSCTPRRLRRVGRGAHVRGCATRDRALPRRAPRVRGAGHDGVRPRGGGAAVGEGARVVRRHARSVSTAPLPTRRASLPCGPSSEPR